MSQNRLFLVPDGEAVTSFRKDCFMTQRQLAEKANISLSTVKKIEEGLADGVRASTFRKLAKALKLGKTPELILRLPKESWTDENGREVDDIYTNYRQLLDQRIRDGDDG